MPKLGILTPAFNRPKELLELGRTILEQTFQDWEWWIALDWPQRSDVVEVAYSFKDPRITLVWVPKVEHKELTGRAGTIMNLVLPRFETEYMLNIPDDDLLYPTGVERLIVNMDHNHLDVAYGRCEIWNMQSDGSYLEVNCGLFPGRILGVGSEPYLSPNCNLDGAQIINRTSLYQKVQKMPEDCVSTGVIDGIFMEVLSREVPFYPIDTNLLVHRRTQFSVNCASPDLHGRSGGANEYLNRKQCTVDWLVKQK